MHYLLSANCRRIDFFSSPHCLFAHFLGVTLSHPAHPPYAHLILPLLLNTQFPSVPSTNQRHQSDCLSLHSSCGLPFPLQVPWHISTATCDFICAFFSLCMFFMKELMQVNWLI